MSLKLVSLSRFSVVGKIGKMMKREGRKIGGYVNTVERVFKEYYSSLCYFASKYLQDEEMVEDVVQDVFITLLEKKTLFQTEIHLKNFLYLSVRNACLNHIRNTHSKDRYLASLSREEETENFEENIILTEVHQELAVAVSSLPEECRKVFDLCYFQGLDNEKAAMELGLSINTVKAQKARGKKILKENLKNIFPMVLLFLNILDKSC